MSTKATCSPQFQNLILGIHATYAQLDYDYSCICANPPNCDYNDCMWAEEIKIEVLGVDNLWTEAADSCNDRSCPCPTPLTHRYGFISYAFQSGKSYRITGTIYGMSCAAKGSVLGQTQVLYNP